MNYTRIRVITCNLGIPAFLSVTAKQNLDEKKMAKVKWLAKPNLTNGIKSKIYHLLDAMGRAHEEIKANDNDNVLKIFTVPEFYFSDSDRTNGSGYTLYHYSYEEYRAIIDILHTNIHGDGKFNALALLNFHAHPSHFFLNSLGKVLRSF